MFGGANQPTSQWKCEPARDGLALLESLHDLGDRARDDTAVAR